MALFAVALRGLIPAGFMVGEAGGPIITICTAQGVVAARIDPETGAFIKLGAPGEAPHEPAQDQSDRVCAFAAIAHAAPAPLDVNVAAPPFAALPAPAPLREPAARPFTTGPPLPARGPPALT